MRIVIKTKNLKLSQGLKDFIEEKLGPIAKFLKIIYDKGKYYNSYFEKGKPRAEMWLEKCQISNLKCQM